MFVLLVSGYEKGPFSEDRVDRFMEEMKKKYQNVIDDTKRKRVQFESNVVTATCLS